MNTKRSTLSVTEGVTRLLAFIVARWPIILIAAYMLTGTGPHLRVSYDYRGPYSDPVFISCTYLGPRGFITPAYGVMDTCPVIAWMSSGAVWQ